MFCLGIQAAGFLQVKEIFSCEGGRSVQNTLRICGASFKYLRFIHDNIIQIMDYFVNFLFRILFVS